MRTFLLILCGILSAQDVITMEKIYADAAQQIILSAHENFSYKIVTENHQELATILESKLHRENAENTGIVRLQTARMEAILQDDSYLLLFELPVEFEEIEHRTITINLKYSMPKYSENPLPKGFSILTNKKHTILNWTLKSAFTLGIIALFYAYRF